MARNTRATGSYSFEWTIGDSTTAAYVDSPILKEFHNSGRTQNGNNFITFAELINIGTFNNFGYLNGDDSNFEKNIINFIRAVDNHLKDLDALITAKEDSQTGYIRVTHIISNTPSLTIAKNSSETLTVTVKPDTATNKNVTWSSSNPAVATVNETTGLVTGIAVGTTTIIATSVDCGKTATISVEVVNELSNFYWYIGVTLPTSIPTSDIQTDNTKPGWHRIGTSLSGFRHDMNNRENWVTLVEHVSSEADLIYYYVVIPDGLNFKDVVGSNLKTNGDFTKERNFSISGYEAYKSNDTTAKVRGLIFEA